jgi:diaminopimelate decarboxylase
MLKTELFDRRRSAMLISIPMDIAVPPLPNSSRVNQAGNLEVAGCDVVDLARKYGTPLYIYDQQQVADRCRAYRDAFAARTDDFEIIYASKAFSCLAMAQLAAAEGLSIDVASGGELHIALRSWFPPERIFVHGNANTAEELGRYVRNEVGHVVVDSLDELEALNVIAGENGRRQPVLLRITPGIEAHTHDFVQTGKLDSKFGFCLAEGVASDAVSAALAQDNLELEGFHVHIGSQIYSLEPFARTISILADFAAECSSESGFTSRLLDMGGGLGASYSPGDEPPRIDELAGLVVDTVRSEMDRVGLPMPRIAVEPGRSIVANACLTAYTVQAVKEIPGVRTYVAVDGGMSDNLRPMLYGARYEALLANRPEASATGTFTVAGKHCESGDILVKDAQLPDPQPGDILVTPSTGAYGYSMAGNYNGQPRPAVLFVREGEARIVIRREEYEDLVRLHEPLP